MRTTTLSQQYLETLIDFLLSAQTSQQLHEMLTMLLTPTELNEISKRLQITLLLKQGIPQRTIAKQLGVGLATVTRGAREMKMSK